MTPRSVTETYDQLFRETRSLFHRLRAVAESLHSEVSAGQRGVLFEVLEQGPRSVPEMARARPVSRQHIQALAQELLAQGLVERLANPAHQRSHLIAATDKGRSLAETIRAREQRFLRQLHRGTKARGIDQETLEIASETLHSICETLAEVEHHEPSNAKKRKRQRS